MSRVKKLASSKESDVKMPNSFEDKKWESFEISLINYLMSIKGVNDVLLAYIIRKEARDFILAITRET